MVFGKAYALIPSYFDRKLETTWAPSIQFPLTTVGSICLALEPIGEFPPMVGTVGSLLWALGVAVLLGAVLWTIRGNEPGAETGTSDAYRFRRRVDRSSNAFVPVALGYLALGSYETLALHTALVTVHLRLNVLGLLGPTILGVVYQFYPPSVSSFSGAADRTALASISGLAGGLLLEAIGLSIDDGSITTMSRAIGLLGASLYLYLLSCLFHERYS